MTTNQCISLIQVPSLNYGIHYDPLLTILWLNNHRFVPMAIIDNSYIAAIYIFDALDII